MEKEGGMKVYWNGSNTLLSSTITLKIPGFKDLLPKIAFEAKLRYGIEVY